MTSTAHSTHAAPTEPLLWPLLRVLARAHAALRSPRPQSGTADAAPYPGLPQRFGNSYLWPDGTWTHSG
jgi:hypothetical protein